MRLCEYKNNGMSCKNWIVDKNEEITFCPVHAGVLKRSEPSPQEKVIQSKFEEHILLCDEMNEEQLKAHILQIESRIEEFKIKLQAANHVRNKRLKADFLSGKLSESQLEEMRSKRFGLKEKIEKSAAEIKLSKEEKEIQSLMKKGLSREKAIKLLSIE